MQATPLWRNSGDKAGSEGRNWGGRNPRPHPPWGMGARHDEGRRMLRRGDCTPRCRAGEAPFRCLAPLRNALTKDAGLVAGGEALEAGEAAVLKEDVLLTRGLVLKQLAGGVFGFAAVANLDATG